jgi:hypothetical protein
MMKRSATLLCCLATVLAGSAHGQPRKAIEGTWAARSSLCKADPTRSVTNADFPLIVTEERVDWALNRCTILKRTGRTGAVQVRARCENNEGVVRQDDFSLRLRGDRLTVTFADGARARYVRCK